MDAYPEFVQDVRDERRPRAPLYEKNLTGWETVRFQLDEEPEPSSAFSTAAFAP